MQKFIVISSLLVISQLTQGPVQADEIDKPASKSEIIENELKEYASVGVKQVKLKNGLKVLLKKTTDDESEVMIRLLAPAGYSCLTKKEKAAGRICSDIAWETGFQDESGDSISTVMYHNCVELTSTIGEFSRSIEGGCLKNETEILLKLIHDLFSKYHFTDDALKSVLNRTKDVIESRPFDHDITFDSVSKVMNTQNHKGFHPTTLKSLAKVDLETAESVYQAAFSDPSEFVCVIIGDFDEKTIVKQIEEHLETIPQSENKLEGKLSDLMTNKPPPHFPNGVVRREISGNKKDTDALNLITFCMKEELNQSNYLSLTAATQVIEVRLREVIREKTHRTFGIDVAYELPLYPYRNPTWITIKYRCAPKDIDMMESLIFRELKKMQKEGPTKAELENVKKMMASTDEFWLKHNCFWQANLINYSLWGWNPQNIIQSYENSPYLTQKSVQDAINRFIDRTNYTRLTAKP